MEIVTNLKRVTYKLLFLVVFFSILLWFSIFLYGLTYYLYLPAVAHTRPIHLQYPGRCMADEVVNPQSTQCPFPSANISLVSQGQYELLSRGQGYTVEVVLEMPESDKNRLQGMFMVKLDMLSPKGEILQSSSRPAVLHYKSWLFKIIYTVFFAPGLLAGTVEEKQVLVVPVFEQYEEHPYQPTHYVYVEIQAKYAEIYSSTLRIHAQFTGLRYLMYYWPVFSAMVGVFMNFFFISLTIMFSWLRYTMNNNGPETAVTQVQNSEPRHISTDDKDGEPSTSQAHLMSEESLGKIRPPPEGTVVTPTAPPASIEELHDIVSPIGGETTLRHRVRQPKINDNEALPVEHIHIHDEDPTTTWTSSDSRAETKSSFAVIEPFSSSSDDSASFKDWEKNSKSASSSSSTPSTSSSSV